MVMDIRIFCGIFLHERSQVVESHKHNVTAGMRSTERIEKERSSTPLRDAPREEIDYFFIPNAKCLSQHPGFRNVLTRVVGYIPYHPDSLESVLLLIPLRNGIVD